MKTRNFWNVIVVALFVLALFTGCDNNHDNGDKGSKTLDRIEITTNPTKTTYWQGENLELAGLVVTAFYKDSTSQTVTSYTTNPQSNTPLNNTALNVVRISYTEGEITETVNLTITVTATSTLDTITLGNNTNIPVTRTAVTATQAHSALTLIADVYASLSAEDKEILDGEIVSITITASGADNATDGILTFAHNSATLKATLETYANTLKCTCTDNKYFDTDDIDLVTGEEKIEKCTGKNCTCIEIFGYVRMENSSGASLGRAPIVRDDFTGDMVTIVANIQTGYADLTGLNKNTISNKIAEVRVTTLTGANICVSDGAGKYIITFREDRTANQIRAIFMEWVSEGIIQ